MCIVEELYDLLKSDTFFSVIALIYLLVAGMGRRWGTVYVNILSINIKKSGVIQVEKIQTLLNLSISSNLSPESEDILNILFVVYFRQSLFLGG